MKFILLSVLSCSIALCSFAQKLSESFNPLIKETSQALKIIQHPDGNYLVYGDIDYYGNVASGSLIKVDQYGNLLQDFQKVYTDREIHKVIILPSGKILIHGPFKWLNGQRVGRVALLNADGSVDPTFWTDTHAMVTNVVVQSTGKIVTVISEGGNLYPEMQRLNSDGIRDYSFSPTYTGYFGNVILGEDDKIYFPYNHIIRRLMPDGQVDNSYVFTDDPDRTINRLVIQEDGKVIACMTQLISTSPLILNYSLQRFTSSGQLDPTFNTGVMDQPVNEMVIRKNNKIAITGYFTSLGSTTGNAFELNSDGSIHHVLATTDGNGMNSLYEDSHQNIFVTGAFETVNNLKVRRIVKLSLGYDVDLSFRLPVFKTAGSSGLMPLGIQSTGKMIIGGSYPFSGVENDSSQIVRLLPNGEPDPSFKAAIRNSSSNFNSPVLYTMAVQED